LDGDGAREEESASNRKAFYNGSFGICAVEEKLGLTIVEPEPAPDNTTEKYGLQVLGLVDAKLRKMKNELDDALSGQSKYSESVGRLQGDRYQIFVLDEKHCTLFFEERVLSKIIEMKNLPATFSEVKHLKRYMIEYAKARARLAEGFPSCKYSNFSLIVTYNGAKAQYRHIDLIEPNNQYLMVLTNNSTPTLGYTAANEIEKPSDLLSTTGWKDIPKNVVSFMEQDALIVQMFEEYGNVLNHHFQEIHHYPSKTEKLPRGALIAMKGG